MQVQAITTYKTNNNQTRPLFKGMPAVKNIKSGMSTAYNSFTDAIAYGEGKLAGTAWMQRFIDFMKDGNYQQHIVAAVGLVLSGFYMADTARSKNIEEDQKMPLIMNQGVVSIGSTVGGYTLDNYLTKKLNNFTEVFNIANISNSQIQKAMVKMHANKDNLEKSDFEELFGLIKNQQGNKTYTYEKEIKESFEVDSSLIKQLKKGLKKQPQDEILKTTIEEINAIDPKSLDKVTKMNSIFLKNMEKSPTMKRMFSHNGFKQSLKIVTENQKGLSQLMTGLKIAKSLMVFGLIYRFISPVIATPIANNLSAKIESKKNK